MSYLCAANQEITSVKIKEIIAALERIAPLPLQESYDNAGLQCGLTETEASGALLCLDVTEAVLQEAVDLGCNLVVSHHPLLFHGLKQVSDTTLVERCLRMAIQNDICLYAAHTNLDNAEDGVNYKIAEKLGLIDVQPLSPSGILGYLPEGEDSLAFLQRVKRAATQPAVGAARAERGHLRRSGRLHAPGCHRGRSRRLPDR